MEENKTQRSKSEDDFEGIGFGECFSNLLNIVALGIIIFIMYLLFNNSFSKNEDKKETTTEIKIQYVPTGNIKIDAEKFNSLLDEKLKEYKDQLKDSEKERNENMKYYATLVSFILAIVGFFGFKSIHDTRQTAMESVKIKAEDVAKKVTSEKIQEYVNKNIETLIVNYLEKDGNELIKKHSKETAEVIAFDESKKVAENFTASEFNKLKNNYEEARNAMRSDIDSIERDRLVLLRRIQDLEQKIYKLPDPEDDSDEPGNDEINDNETLV